MSQKVYKGPYEFTFAELNVEDLQFEPFDPGDVRDAIECVGHLSMSPMCKDVINRCRSWLEAGLPYDKLTDGQKLGGWMVLAEFRRRTKQLSDELRRQAT
ncbi:MAG: hypothetical protein E6Q97_35205 [Desulfurellales bacterium]|nr:MAG: hypothetical protein E6Q97_35205 [Desulfurellales bacterium]